MVGITAYGACIPRLRLDRRAILRAMGWFAPSLAAAAKGERSVCSWDEDAVTMAVAAARSCLKASRRGNPASLRLASTTLPFADRQNAGIVRAALNLKASLASADLAGSQRAGTTALIQALESNQVTGRDELVIASDSRRSKPGSFQEMWQGDGAAAFQVGGGQVLARYLGSYSLAADFNEHFRGERQRFDTVWEERWARDAGYARLIPEAVRGLADRLGLPAERLDTLVFPCAAARERAVILRTLGLGAENEAEPLSKVCGETGTAHPLLMLARALDRAGPGQIVAVVGFGHGCDALAFETTKHLPGHAARGTVEEQLEARTALDSYERYLVFAGHLEPDLGLRAEESLRTAQTVLWRKNDMLLGLVGGACRECGTPQFPRQRVCVNPACGALDSQDPLPFADRPARIMTFTGDRLAASMDPPQTYGMIEFEGGGRFMADFTDCKLEELRVGLPMEMCFRIRAKDQGRGFRSYFWKARPVSEAGAKVRPLRFDGQVAVVTGAGGGLGRAYALALAERGARVVVNDLGGAPDGSGASPAPAEAVVREIREAGGEAVASFESVATPEGGRGIVQTALDTWGRVDILINNAGILRDKSLLKMSVESWQAVLDVHLHGAFQVTAPAVRVMRSQGYGRIVLTTSGAGLYGNFGQANYAAAKMGLVGLMQALKLEGAEHSIRVNAVAPLAGSRLTRDVLPEGLYARLKPELVAPMVLFLCSRDCRESGSIFNCGLGRFDRAVFLAGPGAELDGAQRPATPEAVADSWEAIDSLEGAGEYPDALSAVQCRVSD